MHWYVIENTWCRDPSEKTGHLSTATHTRLCKWTVTYKTTYYALNTNEDNNITIPIYNYSEGQLALFRWCIQNAWGYLRINHHIHDTFCASVPTLTYKNSYARGYLCIILATDIKLDKGQTAICKLSINGGISPKFDIKCIVSRVSTPYRIICLFAIMT